LRAGPRTAAGASRARPPPPTAAPQLCDLYENDCVFDKFGLAVSGDGASAATGTYSSLLRVLPGPGDGSPGAASSAGPRPRAGAPGRLLEASRDPLRARAGGAGGPPPARGRFGLPPRPGDGDAAASTATPGGPDDDGPGAVGADLSSKMLHLAWHPGAPVLAAAASNSLYLYHATGAG
jgi:serine/threonine-protein phosphatase 2A regulatory subunit B